MKIAASVIQPIVREPAKPSAARAQTSDAAKPAKAVDLGGQKATPPGLERALARLQSLPERNTGQANAMDRISRNIARYAETQALVAPPQATPAPTPSSAADAATTTGATALTPAEPDTSATAEATHSGNTTIV